jgi:hypothetical protein
MGTVTVFDANRMLEIENGTIVDGSVIGDNLILEKKDGTPVDAGNVRGPQGIQGNTGAAGADAAFLVRASDPGTNLTLSGTQTIDGVSLNVGDRVLAKNQTTSSANGIYVVASGAWTRATDANTSAKISGGVVNVQQGGTNGGQRFTNTFKSSDTLGTTSMPWYRVLDGSNVAYLPWTGTTDASGLITVTHNLGWAPRMIFGMQGSPTSRFAMLWGCDTIGTTTFRARMMNASTAGALASLDIGSFVFMCVR